MKDFLLLKEKIPLPLPSEKADGNYLRLPISFSLGEFPADILRSCQQNESKELLVAIGNFIDFART